MKSDWLHLQSTASFTTGVDTALITMIHQVPDYNMMWLIWCYLRTSGVREFQMRIIILGLVDGFKRSETALIFYADFL